MSKKIGGPRRNSVDSRAYGIEPDLRNSKSRIDIANAYNWYNYFFDSDKAKEFLISYMEGQKFPKADVSAIKRLDRRALPLYVGWNARILSLGGKLPEDYVTRMRNVIDKLVKLNPHIDDENTEEVSKKPKVSIQERVKEKSNTIIGEIEAELDAFYVDNSHEFDVYEYMSKNGIKPIAANAVAEYYIPIFNELIDVMDEGPADLKEGYRSRSKDSIILEIQFIQKLIEDAQRFASNVKKTRKPRVKKEKSADKQVSKIKFKPSDDKYKITSVRAIDIVGADQLWIFNTKTRMLGVYKSNGPNGLAVKGSTILNFDEKESILKKLRKPEETLKIVNDAGKVQLRKLMDTIKCKPKAANGRINADTVLVRVVK